MSETGAEHDNGAAAVDPLVGKVLSGRFRLTRLVARGGMGKIYEATQEPLGRTVALKILDIHDAGDEFRRRFFLEASHCAKLSHPNTVRIYDYGETDDGIYYIAMEFLRGHTLHHLVESEAPLDPLRVVKIARQLCSALAEAHDAGIIHRDLKPANVFLAPHGDDPDFVKVVDFGLVKEMGKESELSRTGHVLGSPLYMAPEQIHNTEVDQRTDVYATGLILYAMLTGRTAFRRGNPLAVLMAQASQKPPTFAEANPEVQVPASLEWVVQTCIAKKADDRFASMHELLRALKACTKELRGETSGPLRLALVDGRVVLPSGLDVSEEIRFATGDLEIGLQEGGSTTLVQRSGKQAAPVAAEPPAERSQATRAIVLVGTTGALVIGAAVLILVGTTLVLAWMVWGRVPAEPVAAVEPVPVVAPEPDVPDEPEAPVEPEAPAPVEVTLSSTPDAAEVERDGVLLGTTPLTLRIPEGEEWIVDVRHGGYLTRTVRLAADQPELDVVLEAEPSRKASPRASRTAVTQPAPVAAPEPQPDAPEAEPVPQPQPRRGDIRNPWD